MCWILGLVRPARPEPRRGGRAGLCLVRFRPRLTSARGQVPRGARFLLGQVSLVVRVLGGAPLPLGLPVLVVGLDLAMYAPIRKAAPTTSETINRTTW